jgi:hypothetical protein
LQHDFARSLKKYFRDRPKVAGHSLRKLGDAQRHRPACGEPDGRQFFNSSMNLRYAHDQPRLQ